MAQEPAPFELQQPQRPPPQFGGVTQITPQEGQVAYEGGSNFQLSPEAMQMMWAPQGPMIAPQVQPQPPPPQINPFL